jgi:hypothetical protein
MHGSPLHTGAKKRITQSATNAGTDAGRLVRDATLRLLEKDDELPVIPDVVRTTAVALGSVGALDRPDVYDAN